MNEFTLEMYSFWNMMTNQQRHRVRVILLCAGVPGMGRGQWCPSWRGARGRAAMPHARWGPALLETCTCVGNVLSSLAALIFLCLFAAFCKYCTSLGWGWGLHSRRRDRRQESQSLHGLPVITWLLCINPALSQPSAGITRGQNHPRKMQLHPRGSDDPLLSQGNC